MSSHRPRAVKATAIAAGGLMNRDSPLPRWGSSSSFLGICLQKRSTLGKGTAILIGILLLFSLMSVKKSEASSNGIHHRKLGAHDFAFIDPENPEVAKVIQEDIDMSQQRDSVPRTTKPALVRPQTKIMAPDVRQKRIQVNREVAQQLPPPQGLYAMHAMDIDGNDVPMGDFAGKVLLIVNVASACGYTEQNYKGLQALYEKYGSYGLEIIAFPSNQFGGQEPGTEQHIKQYVTSKYNVTFKMMSKVDVNGPNAHPIFKYLKKQLPVDQGGGGGVAPGNDLVWNFNKFLVDKHGRPVSFYYQNFDATRLEGDVFTYLSAT